MSEVELLSPAGGWDSLKAAVTEGADAVYFGVGDFNARRRAENFTPANLNDAVKHCHERGVRAYLAANTLVKNAELSEWFKTLEAAYSGGVDAVIVQEVPFIPLLKDSFPDMQVHVSTQAGVFNSLWSSVLSGADRVIMPREMTLKQVRDFHERTHMPVEVFVQGALCFSISGQCLMSGFLGGRSGNRGLCAQPCRKLYNGKYHLSTRDLCLVRRLPDIVAAGVSSLKIEGRLRSAEYVGAATALYRRALDSIMSGRFEVDEDAYTDVELSFNREFTGGGMFKEYDVATPGECGKRGVALGELSDDGSMRLKAPIMVGDGVGIFTKKGSHGDIIRKIDVSGRQVRQAERGQTARLYINAHAGDAVYITSGVMRRRPYKVHGRKIILVRREKLKAKMPTFAQAGFDKPRLLVKTYSLKDAELALECGADSAYYSVLAKDFPSEGRICPYIPRSLFDWSAEEVKERAETMRPGSVLCGDLGVASQIKSGKVYLDISCNAFNDIDVGFFNQLGMTPTISPELTFDEMSKLKDKRFAVYSHGRIPLMSTKYSLKELTLRDELGYTFPVRGEGDMRQVLNSVPFGLYSDILRLRDAGIVEYLLDLDGAVAATVDLYKRILGGERIERPPSHTQGHFKEPTD